MRHIPTTPTTHVAHHIIAAVQLHPQAPACVRTARTAWSAPTLRVDAQAASRHICCALACGLKHAPTSLTHTTYVRTGDTCRTAGREQFKGAHSMLTCRVHKALARTPLCAAAACPSRAAAAAAAAAAA
jgi:hypothetical protein